MILCQILSDVTIFLKEKLQILSSILNKEVDNNSAEMDKSVEL